MNKKLQSLIESQNNQNASSRNPFINLTTKLSRTRNAIMKEIFPTEIIRGHWDNRDRIIVLSLAKRAELMKSVFNKYGIVTCDVPLLENDIEEEISLLFKEKPELLEFVKITTNETAKQYKAVEDRLVDYLVSVLKDYV